MIFTKKKLKKKNIKNKIIPYDLDSLSKYAEIEEMSFEQMENDLEEFCYILENCYAGLEAAKSKGLRTLYINYIRFIPARQIRRRIARRKAL